jgi:hypothetical protein
MSAVESRLGPQRRRLRPRVAWRPGRTSAIIVVLVGSLAGAAAGAQLHRQPEFRYTAEVVVVTDRVQSGFDVLERRPAVRLARFAEVLDLPHVETAARETTSARGNLRERVSVSASQSSGLMRITAHDRSPEEAAELANAFVDHALTFIRGLDSLEGDRFALGDFEGGFEGWNEASQFAVPPSSLRLVTAHPKFNSSALHVTCQARPACGPAVRFFYPFQSHRMYEATAWLRASDRRFLVTMVFGANPADYALLSPTRLGRRWNRYSLQWVPNESYARGEVTVQSAGGGAADFYIDGVSLSGASASPRSRPSEEAEGQAFAKGPYVAASPAVPTGVVDRRTWLWTLAGASFGMIAAALAVGIGWAAARRQT